MKLRLAAIFCVICILTGCGGRNAVDRAVQLRTDIHGGKGCAFACKITADYGEKIYTFGMECQGNQKGDLTFTVTEPATISGICGMITQEEGALTFDDRVLAFETIADDYLTPVSAPWVLLKALRGGYVNSCIETDSGYCMELDDTYRGTAMRLLVYTDSGFVPIGAEVFWNNRRILTLQVDNFTIV